VSRVVNQLVDEVHLVGGVALDERQRLALIEAENEQASRGEQRGYYRRAWESDWARNVL
jgi:hypothetical protein